MENQKSILNFISTLRNSFDGCDEVFKAGSCYQLYKILKSIYPSAECFISLYKSHTITQIDGVYYDIDGVCEDTDSYKHISTITEYSHESINSKVFSIWKLSVVDNPVSK